MHWLRKLGAILFSIFFPFFFLLNSDLFVSFVFLVLSGLKINQPGVVPFVRSIIQCLVTALFPSTANQIAAITALHGGLTGFYQVYTGFTGFLLDLTGFYWLTGFDWV